MTNETKTTTTVVASLNSTPVVCNGGLRCPCGEPLLLVGATGSADDTASGTSYDCTAGHHWIRMIYTARPSASGWYRRPGVAETVAS